MRTKLFLLLIFITNFTSLVVQAQEDLLPFNLKRETDVLVEILIAGPQTSEMASMFGHLGLRLKYISNSGKQHDFALSFVANTEEETGFKRDVKGLVGFYKMNLLIETFDQYIKRTTQIENRTIHRYILNSNHQNIENLFKKLNEFKNEGLKLGNYSFLSKNCATTLYEFFFEMGYFINKKFNSLFPIPPVSYARAVFAPVMLGFLQLPRIESIGSQLNVLEKQYGFTLNREKRSDNDISILFSSLSKMNVSELNLFLRLDLSEIPGLRTRVLKEIRYQNGAISDDTHHVLGFNEIPAVLYKMCRNYECAMNQAKELNVIFGKKYLIDTYNYLNYEIRRSRQLIFFSELEKTDQYRHAVLLTEALGSFR